MFDKGSQASSQPSLLKEAPASAHRRKRAVEKIPSLKGEEVFLGVRKPAKLFIPIEKKTERTLLELRGCCGPLIAGRSAHRRSSKNWKGVLDYVRLPQVVITLSPGHRSPEGSRIMPSTS